MAVPVIGLPDVNEPYRGWKITLFEGHSGSVPGPLAGPFACRRNIRCACILRYVCHRRGSHTDLPIDQVVDGVDLTAYVTGIDTTQAHMSTYSFAVVPPKRFATALEAHGQRARGTATQEWLFDLTAEGEWRTC